MFYKDREHFKETAGYVVNNVWYPRVTKILEVKSKPGLDKFFQEVGHYAHAEDIKNKSAEEGSLMHNTLESLALGKSIEVPAEVLPAAQAFLKYKEENGIKFFPNFVELRFHSLRHRYAGTIDALAEVNGKFGVLDIKTSAGFYPEYNLQTAAYISALQEFEVKKMLVLPRAVETRWIMLVKQHARCKKCNSTLRTKGGRSKVKNGVRGGNSFCPDGEHEWGEIEGAVELREFPYFYKDVRAFLAAKILWEWENDYWLRQIGYLQ